MKIKANKPREHLLEDIAQWPIAKLYADRDALVKEVQQEALNNLDSTKSAEELKNLLTKTIYRERIRLKNNPWKVDLRSEPKFWAKMRTDLLAAEKIDASEAERHQAYFKILKTIVLRYSEEIVGGFNERTIRFARKFLKFFFKRMLMASNLLSFSKKKKGRVQLHDRIKVYGDLNKVAGLFNEGIVVVLPTHASNVDSLLIAYSMDLIAGLPSFCYGAGLNLLNSEILSYFMNRVGIYRIDRRKKNPIYLETLMSFSRLSLLKGTNTIFFPGGTRSRSGQIETNLKLGLMHTLIDAQKQLIEKGSHQKIFVVPLIISYNVVLEAQALIHQHLHRGGEDKYLNSKETNFSIRKIVNFSWNYFRQGSEIAMSFGQPFDVLGNSVSESGISLDNWNREIDLQEYFMDENGIIEDGQRDRVYTQKLGEKVVREYHRYNVILSGHVLAYVAFHMFYREFRELEIYDALNLKRWDIELPYDLFKTTTKRFIKHLEEKEQEGKLLLEPRLAKSFKKVLKKGLKHLGVFHNKDVLSLTKDKSRLTTKDHRLLYYYANRLETYNFDLDAILSKK